MTTKQKQPKAPRTIKVMTLVWTIVAIIAFAVVAVSSYQYGWDARSADQSRVSAEAAALVSKLKSQN